MAAEGHSRKAPATAATLCACGHSFARHINREGPCKAHYRANYCACGHATNTNSATKRGPNPTAKGHH